MDCEEARSLLIQKEEGTLSPEDGNILDRHLAACERCKEDLALISVSFEALRGALDEKPPTHYFSNLLPHIHERIERRSRSWSGIALPLWAQRLLAPGSALAVLGSIVALYIVLTPSFNPSGSVLQQILTEVPRDDMDRVTESLLYAGPLARAMEPSQRALETFANPSAVSQQIDRELVDDQLEHGHSLSVFLAGDNPVEDITDEDVDPVILRLDKTSL